MLSSFFEKNHKSSLCFMMNYGNINLMFLFESFERVRHLSLFVLKVEAEQK
jgi:hypothetical protein